tara:strand:+ start:562 stop:1221 length:660 start_codon:yes stop_codon:yes gene_type:complete
MTKKTNEKRIRAILFDFDGVLIDSLPAMRAGWNQVCKKYSLKKDFLDYSKFIGIPFNSILLKLNIEEKLHQKINDDYFQVTNQKKHLIKINTNVHEIIKWASENFIKVGIVTSKNRQSSLSLIDFFQIKIDLLVTPDLTSKGKPNAEPIFLAAKKLEISPKDILFVGDMKTDMICAKNAGCSYLHYQLGYEKLFIQEYGGQIESLLEIKEFVKYYREAN